MKLTYRPEIDGLRAIAIIFIILSHFKQLNFVSGGVNIFFVISGYLITHILLNQQLDIFKFYKTRFFRLYPNIFIISLITLILFLFLGHPNQWIIIVHSFIATITGSFNFYLIKIGDVYGQANNINPFLPFWAFCVIIQFYLIFPFILKIIFLVKRKFNLNDNFIINSLIIVSVILFLLYMYYRDSNFLFSFYSPLSRYWQFILGSSFYFIIKSKSKLHFNNLTIYFAVFFICIWQLNLEWFSSWRKIQVLLTISTLLFLYSAKKNIFNKILTLKPLTYLGKISYELYLIHMAVIYFVDLYFDQGIVLLSLTLLILITYLYKKFVNQPSYKKIIVIFENKLFIFFLLSFIITTQSFVFNEKYFSSEKEIYFKNLFLNINLIEKINKSYEKMNANNGVQAEHLVIGNDGKPCLRIIFDKEFVKNCSFINTKNDTNFFLIGGSQVSTLGYNLKQRLKDFNYHHFTLSDSIYLPNFHKINTVVNKKELEFLERNNIIRNLLLSVNKKSIVLIHSRYPVFLHKSYFDNEEGGVEGGAWPHKFEHIEDSSIKWQDDFKNSVEELATNNNIKIILLYQIPAIGFNPNDRLKKILNTRIKPLDFIIKNKFDTSYHVFKKRTQSSFELLDSIKGDNIYRVYPHQIFCDTDIKNRCIVFKDKNLLYYDDDHPSVKGAEMINDLLIKEIKKIEFKSN